MSTTNLSPLDEKGGDKILRQVSQEFLPWCHICNRAVWDFWLGSELEARQMLWAHQKVSHFTPDQTN